MGGRGASSGITNKNSNIISFEKFMKLEPREKGQYFHKMVENAYGDKLRAGQAQDYLNKIGIERYDYWASLRNGFDFKKEYKKIIKLDKAAQDRIKQQKKEKALREKRLNEQEKFYKKYGRDAIKAKYDGFDQEGNRIKVGDIIKKTNTGWKKIEK